MAKRVCTIMGVGFLLVGILGFVMPEMLGMHLSVTHSVIHLVTGATALYLGLKGSLSAARVFCIAFGAVYLLLGIAGFLFGHDADPSPGIPGPHDGKLMRVLPGAFEVGTPDHLVHVLLGAIFLIGGFMTAKAINDRNTARV